MKIIEKILDLETGEETLLEREETAQERTDRLAFEKQKAEIEAEALKVAEAKKVLFDRLGITAEEAELLLA